MQIKFGILKKGDIAVKKKNGDVEIYQFYLDDEGLPRLAENTVLVTQGAGSISAKAGDGSVEVMMF